MEYQIFVYEINLFVDLELACERECSRGEDYRLIKLTIIDYNVNRQLFLYLILSSKSFNLL